MNSQQPINNINRKTFNSQLFSFAVIKLMIAFLLLITACSNKADAAVIKAGIMESTPVSIVAEWYIGKDTQEGEHFTARVTESLIAPNGEVIIPRNSKVAGTVIKVKKAKSFHRNAEVDILFNKIILPDNVQTISIDADGGMILEKHQKLKLAREGLIKTGIGGAMGALGGIKFAGITGAYGSLGNTLSIGAATGASLALISFVAEKGESVEIYPGLSMNLNLVSIEAKNFKEQKMPQISTGVDAKILDFKNNKVSLEISNNKSESLKVSNIKIVDGLGYSFNPLNVSNQTLAPHSKNKLTLEFPPVIENSKQWLILTDSFHKREFFREAIN